MFISSMIIFGTIGVFRRYIPASSAFLAFSRGILGGLCILLFLKLKKKDHTEKIPGSAMRGLIVSGALIGINWILLFEAYNHTTVAVATLCYYMQPTIVTLLSPLLFRERLTGRKAACAAVAVAGMVLVSGVLEGARGGNLRGVLFGLGAALFYSAVVIMNKRITGVDMYRKTTVQLLSAGAVMIPYLLLTGGFGGEGFTPAAVVLLAVVGIVHTGLAYVLYFGSMDGLRVQTVAILSYIDPVSALLFSALLLREPLSALGVLGAAMILGSAIVSETGKTKEAS
ncbi:MAG: EamA family transporter [Clostridia bacterium]|nr:EamA family transporter [Clostridia bacterium]MBR2662606.1 EamA family transporter [Clostridia bacterium]